MKNLDKSVLDSIDIARVSITLNKPGETTMIEAFNRLLEQLKKGRD
ncbi:hypothetical protein LC085_07565 [Bacillus tianshenii]|nr:hypothetical protein [Bacillus tianshenii]MCA1319769.1 hypothetical protein [Bacillus tianshenii]